jgi:cytoskeletal protein RodZ
MSSAQNSKGGLLRILTIFLVLALFILGWLLIRSNRQNKATSFSAPAKTETESTRTDSSMPPSSTSTDSTGTEAAPSAQPQSWQLDHPSINRPSVTNHEHAKMQKPIRASDSKVSSTSTPALTVQVGKKTYKLQPNEIGNFGRIYVKEQETAKVQLVLPKGEPGQGIGLQAEDGGRLDNGSIAKVDKLDVNSSVAFNFQVTQNRGTHRVTMTKGNETYMIDFWVGPELGIRN